MQNLRKRILWADVIRIVAMLLVILIHSVDAVVYQWGKAPFKHGVIPSWWMTGIAFKSLASVCVPLLFMLSGYLILSSNDSIFVFFKKRLIKIIIPLVAWSILYMWWDGTFAENITVAKTIKLVIRSILEGPVYFHLWFLYSLLGLYVVTPIIRRFVQTASDTELLYFIGLWIFATVAFNLLQQLKGINVALFGQPYVSGFLGYYVAGYYFGKKEYSQRQIWIAFGVLTLMVAGKTLWIYYLTYDGGMFDTYLFEYLNWHLILTSFASFIAFKGILQNMTYSISPRLEKTIVTVSGATFGIYLVHILILNLLDHGTLGFRISTDITHPLIAIPLTVIVTFLLSFVVTYILQKIPVIKMIVP